jgi:hypothetical protein
MEENRDLEIFNKLSSVSDLLDVIQNISRSSNSLFDERIEKIRCDIEDLKEDIFGYLTKRKLEIMEEKEVRDCSVWTTSELFGYAISMGLIDSDEEFENWKHERSDLVYMVQEDLDERED